MEEFSEQVIGDNLTQQAPKKNLLKKYWIGIVGLVIVFAVGFYVWSVNRPVDFNKVVENSVSWTEERGFKVSEDGRSLVFSGIPDPARGVQIKTLHTKLKLPDSLWAKMGQTRALDGRQSEEFDKIKVSWTYHPDNGLNILYESK